MHLLELKNVSVAYDAVMALQDCSIYIDEGEMISIVGSNGAGKTTTCRAISGVLDLKGGESHNRWPHAVYFRALWALWSWTPSPRTPSRATITV